METGDESTMLGNSFCPMVLNTDRELSSHAAHEKNLKKKITNLIYITITCACSVYSQIPHFYIVKQGFKGVYLIISFLIQNIHCGYSLEPP